MFEIPFHRGTPKPPDQHGDIHYKSLANDSDDDLKLNKKQRLNLLYIKIILTMNLKIYGVMVNVHQCQQYRDCHQYTQDKFPIHIVNDNRMLGRSKLCTSPNLTRLPCCLGLIFFFLVKVFRL